MSTWNTRTQQLHELLGRLRRRFSNQPNLLQHRHGAIRLPIESWSPHWIVSRGSCMFRAEHFDNVPKAKRDAAVSSNVELWSPFDRTDHHCVWAEDTAMVWFWDAALTERLVEDSHAEGSLPEAFHTLPETVFLPRGEDGFVLRSCHEGFELQLWQAGLLLDSAWTAAPGSGLVDEFKARHGLQAGPEGAAPNDMAPDPWASPLTPREWALANERRLVAACLVLLSGILIGQEARYWHIGSLQRGAAGEFQALQSEVGPLLEARTQAQGLQRSNQLLARLVERPSQARLMSLVDEALPNDDAEFREWHYQQGELRMILEDPDMNPIEYVRSLEAQHLFTEVRAEQARGRNRVEVVMQIDSGS